MNELSPIASEFDSEEAAKAYDAWFRAKVAKSLADTRPVMTHDEAMTRLRAILAAHRQMGNGD